MTRWRSCSLVLGAVVGALSTPLQAAYSYDVSRLTFASSGGRVGDGSFEVSFTVGEGIAAPLASAGSTTVGLGFWTPPPDDVPTSVEDQPPQAWANSLMASRPNPFRDHAVLHYTVGTRARVRVSIFDVTGCRVRSLINRTQDAGEHLLRWDGRDDTGHTLASGPYFYRLEVGSWSQTGKLTKIR